MFSGVEDFGVTTGDYNDTIAVGDGDDVLSTGKGDDNVTAGACDDRLDGGEGVDDLLSISYADETEGVSLDLRRSGEQQVGGTGSVRNFEGFTGTVTGSAFADTFIDSGRQRVVTFNSGDGDDLVQVSMANDVANLGAGVDRLVIDFSSFGDGNYIAGELNGSLPTGYSGRYVTNAFGVGTVTFSGVENFTIAAGASFDRIVTGDGDDIVSGNAGDDVLTVAKGADAIDGGVGIDTLSISFADERTGVTVNLLAAAQQQSGGTGSITNIESFGGTVVGSDFADTFIEGLRLQRHLRHRQG